MLNSGIFMCMANFSLVYSVSQKLLVVEKIRTLYCDRGGKITPSNLFLKRPGEITNFQFFCDSQKRRPGQILKPKPKKS